MTADEEILQLLRRQRVQKAPSSRRAAPYAAKVPPQLADKGINLVGQGESSPLAALSSPSPFRPVQFLGAKTRVLESLGAAAREHLDPGDHILDVFTGSSLVAQHLAREGFRLTASDALEHCVHFARALLAVDRPNEPKFPHPPLLDEGENWMKPWQPWLRREEVALSKEDSDALIHLAQTTPQVWRQANASSGLKQQFGEMCPGGRSPALVTAHYAGTYFGIRQALAIDKLRCAILQARMHDQIGCWEESALLTALLSAASECAFSAGKHYAQPHRIRPDKDLSFIRSRILADRSRDISVLFVERLIALQGAAKSAGTNHAAKRLTLEEFCAEPRRIGKINAIYADPPYTSQQYSRFYHVPEVICSYRVPILQKNGNAVTRGLYPEGRFKSRFCSRRLAKDAFGDLIALAQAHRAVLILSYSGTRSGVTGNERSISISELRYLLHSSYGRRRVQEKHLHVTYRQFNSAEASISKRDDVETLFTAVPNA